MVGLLAPAQGHPSCSQGQKGPEKLQAQKPSVTRRASCLPVTPPPPHCHVLPQHFLGNGLPLSVLAFPLAPGRALLITHLCPPFPHPLDTSTLLRLLQILAALHSWCLAVASAGEEPDTKVPRAWVWGRGPRKPHSPPGLVHFKQQHLWYVSGCPGSPQPGGLMSKRCLRTTSSHPSPTRFMLTGGFLLWISWIP